MHRSFLVSISHGGKPLAGVRVHITGQAEIDGVTEADGKIKFLDLAPGDYWLTADLLGINAAYECFHVTAQSSRKAKRVLQLNWGDEATAVRQISGVLADSEPGKGGNIVWNTTHRVQVPIVGAKIVLRDPLARREAQTISTEQGTFAFDKLPQGTYVLHIEHGTGGSDFDPTDVLIRLSLSASKGNLTLIRTKPSGGSCGGTSLELM